MYFQYVSLEEFVEIYKEIRLKFILGVYWGIFKQMGCFEVIIRFLLIIDISYFEVFFLLR